MEAVINFGIGLTKLFKTITLRDFIMACIQTIFLTIDSLIYGLIAKGFELFNILAQVQLFSDDNIRELSSRIYIIIGVVSTFLIAYALLLAIINPESSSKNGQSLGKIIPNIALAIIGIAIVPIAFDYAYKFQHSILCNNVIGRLFLADDSFDSSVDTTVYNGGVQLAVNTFGVFFHHRIDETAGLGTDLMRYLLTGSAKAGDNKLWEEAYDHAMAGQPLVWAYKDLVTTQECEYIFLISSLAGFYIIYVIINLCIDMAVRAVKLSYLQIIAPLPILTIIIPGQKKVFQNWLKKTISCFLEVFSRIAIVVLVLYLLKNLPNALFGGHIFERLCGFFDIGMILWVYLGIVLGMMSFIKNGPKFLGEIAGLDSKGFKLGIREKLADTGAFRVAGAVGGLVSGGVKAGFSADPTKFNPLDALQGGFGGLTKGWKNTKDAKTFTDVAKGAGKGATDSISDMYKRKAYKEQHRGSYFRGIEDDVSDYIKDFKNDDAGKYAYLENLSKKNKEVKDAKSHIEDDALNFVKKHSKFLSVDSNGTKLEDLYSRLEIVNSTPINRNDYATDADYEQALKKQSQLNTKLKQEIYNAEKFLRNQAISGNLDQQRAGESNVDFYKRILNANGYSGEALQQPNESIQQYETRMNNFITSNLNLSAALLKTEESETLASDASDLLTKYKENITNIETDATKINNVKNLNDDQFRQDYTSQQITDHLDEFGEKYQRIVGDMNRIASKLRSKQDK